VELEFWRSVERVGSMVLLEASLRSFEVAVVVREARGISPRRECWRDIGGRLALSLVVGRRSEVFEELREGGPTNR
jgi:hypothetical protein